MNKEDKDLQEQRLQYEHGELDEDESYDYLAEIKKDKNRIDNLQRWEMLDIAIELLLIDGLVNTDELRDAIEIEIKKYEH